MHSQLNKAFHAFEAIEVCIGYLKHLLGTRMPRVETRETPGFGSFSLESRVQYRRGERAPLLELRPSLRLVSRQAVPRSATTRWRILDAEESRFHWLLPPERKAMPNSMRQAAVQVAPSGA